MTLEIIAELAQGFEGRPEQTRLLLQAAAKAGADVAKYQLVYADELATPDYEHYELFTSLEMPDQAWISLADFASKLEIGLAFDIFGERSLDLACRVDASAVKLHGTDIANVGLLNSVAASPVNRVMLGAGGAFAEEIDSALEILQAKQVVVLLGFQGYPTPNETNQISRVSLLAERFAGSSERVAIGFADHADPDDTLRYALAATAVGAGASVVEKHLTLGRIMQLEDHESALNPDEFLEFSQTLRSCAEAFGHSRDSNDFDMSDAEQAYRKMIRRHVVSTRDLEAGTRLVPADLGLKRTSSNKAVTDLGEAYDKILKQELGKNSPLLRSDID